MLLQTEAEVPISTIRGCHRKWGVLEGDKSDRIIRVSFNQTTPLLESWSRKELIYAYLSDYISKSEMNVRKSVLMTWHQAYRQSLWV